MRATMGLGGVTCMVEGQIEAWQRRAQLVTPIGQLWFERLLAETFPSPRGVVCVLHGERPKLGGFVCSILPVQPGHLVQPHQSRPAVEGDVMHIDEQHMVVRGQAEEACVQDGTPCEVELPVALRLQQFLQDLIG